MRDDPAARWPKMEDAARRDHARPDAWKWRRAAIGVAVAAAFAAATVFAVERGQNRARAMCLGGEARVASVWSERRPRRAWRRAFAKTRRLVRRAQRRQTISQALDSYAHEWATMNDDACSPRRASAASNRNDVLDLRTACPLGHRLKELSALVDVVRHADVETVQQASRASQALTPLADCADIAALRAPTPRPRDPAAAAKVEELRARLAIVQANYAVGRATDAAKLGDALLHDAESTGFGPLVSQVHFWRGRAFADLGDSDNSIPAFRDAFTIALASRSDRVLRESASRLAQEYIYASDVKAFDVWAQVADAAIARSGPDPETENFLQHVRCVAMWAKMGAVHSRLACLEKYTAKVERRAEAQTSGSW